MSKEKLSIEEIRYYLECTSYSNTEGEDFELEKDEEYVQPPQSSSSDSEDYSDDFDKPFGKYKKLLRYIRFDILSTRSQRLQNNKFALISMVWDRFVENCKSSYMPSENITMDEQQLPTKARYPFTQYMAKKPDKFGIKFWFAVDASSKYLVNGFPYMGKYFQRPAYKSLSEYVVMKLMKPYLGKGRTVTTDNFFTSLSLTNELQKNRTTILGTLHRARKEIPPDLKASKQALFSTLIFVNSDKTLTSYQGEKKMF
ncbi:piggyBac transposable element-derived protein 4-like [Lepeophtheirus salmonis]|uniref:piggyBac transposable element-derived protein 4-like n=1 Tax=Lepeophtheirus salmonis TaxID=72036 RepID=UPI003AF363AA